MRALAGAAWISAALVVGACGGTAPLPSTPTPVSRYPSLLGGSGPWRENESSLVLRYRDSTESLYYNCDAQMNVGTQTEGNFEGSVSLQGVGADSDRQCTHVSGFTAQMTPDGTVTGFHLIVPFVGRDCTTTGESTVRGTATGTAIRVEITDRPTCKDPFGKLREFDRTLTISVVRRQ